MSTADTAFRAGDPLITRLAGGLFHPKNPVLGTEFAGVVDAVGDRVTRFEVGDQVFAATGVDFGAHAEYVCMPEDGALAVMPSNVTFSEAAALCEAGLTALPFLRDVGKIQSGHQVLINGGSGSVGAAAVQLARHFGAEVTGVCSTRNLELVRSLGAHHVIDYTTTDFTHTGRSWDIVFDTVGKSSFSRCRSSLKPGGIYLTPVLSAGAVLHSLWTSAFGTKKASIAFTGLRAVEEKASDLVRLRTLVEAGALRPVIDRCFALDEVADAHRLVETGHKRGNAVLQVA